MNQQYNVANQILDHAYMDLDQKKPHLADDHGNASSIAALRILTTILSKSNPMLEKLVHENPIFSEIHRASMTNGPPLCQRTPPVRAASWTWNAHFGMK